MDLEGNDVPSLNNSSNNIIQKLTSLEVTGSHMRKNPLFVSPPFLETNPFRMVYSTCPCIFIKQNMQKRPPLYQGSKMKANINWILNIEINTTKSPWRMDNSCYILINHVDIIRMLQMNTIDFGAPIFLRHKKLNECHVFFKNVIASVYYHRFIFE